MTIPRRDMHLWLVVLMLSLGAPARAGDSAVDVGANLPQATEVGEGLFPEERCEQLKAAGFKCLDVKPAVRYSLPGSAFKPGSVELPDLLKKQLKVFAEVLKARRGTGKQVQVEAHSDASGSAKLNDGLSLRRAQAVVSYLVSLGVDPGMLAAAGAGARKPKNAANPRAAENRRVEIGRVSAP